MFSWIRDLFGGVNKTIDTLDVSGNKKAEIKNKLAEIQLEANKQFLDLAKSEMEMRAKVIQAEAGSTHWLQANWRPLTSIMLIGIIVLDSFNFVNANQELYTLATAFLGLYGAGRSWEKASKSKELGK